jgi:hypothetical protein
MRCTSSRCPTSGNAKLRFGGERFAPTPENAGNIRRAVQRMRAGLLNVNTQTQAPPPAEPSLRNLTSRLDVCFEEIARLADRPLESSGESGLRVLFKHVSQRINQISRSIRPAAPRPTRLLLVSSPECSQNSVFRI